MSASAMCGRADIPIRQCLLLACWVSWHVQQAAVLVNLCTALLVHSCCLLFTSPFPCSPSLAAMIAHKKGHNPLLDGGELSPPSHIKAVFATTEDREFYGPMAGGWKGTRWRPVECVKKLPGNAQHKTSAMQHLPCNSVRMQ